MLLPADTSAARAAVEEAEALRRQLLDRARMRAAADWLERRARLDRDAFRSGQPEITVPAAAVTDRIATRLPAGVAGAGKPGGRVRPRPPPLWTANDACGDSPAC